MAMSGRMGERTVEMAKQAVRDSVQKDLGGSCPELEEAMDALIEAVSRSARTPSKVHLTIRAGALVIQLSALVWLMWKLGMA